MGGGIVFKRTCEGALQLELRNNKSITDLKRLCSAYLILAVYYTFFRLYNSILVNVPNLHPKLSAKHIINTEHRQI